MEKLNIVNREQQISKSQFSIHEIRFDLDGITYCIKNNFQTNGQQTENFGARICSKIWVR